MRRYSTQQNVNTKMVWRKLGSKLILNNQNSTKKKTKNRSRNIIWFNPLFNKIVPTNVATMFPWLINGHFPKSHRLHKIFNRKAVKVSYSCMQNMSKIYKGHNRKSTFTPCNQLIWWWWWYYVTVEKKENFSWTVNAKLWMQSCHFIRATKNLFWVDRRKMEAKVL